MAPGTAHPGGHDLTRPASAAAALLLAAAGGAAQAGTLRYCDASPPLAAPQQDRMLRVAAVVKEELEKSGTRAALIARSGLNLRWFDMRYSHAGISLQASTESRWAVRQLYFACDEQLPRLFDQGLSAFLLGTEDPALGFISVVTLPEPAARRLEPVALDNRRALSLLSPNYSANAYAWGLQFQNCNQWLAELLATAWRTPVVGDPDGVAPDAATAPRAAAQGWLQAQGFEPARFELGWRPLTWLTALSPYLQHGDHPEAELAQARFVVTMPASIEAFVMQREPEARRIEFCHTDRHVLVRRNGPPLADGCVAEPGDRIVPLS